MKPKSGKAIAAVAPKEPAAAEEADSADPGEVEKVKTEQIKASSGKYGSAKTKPFQPPKDSGGAGGSGSNAGSKNPGGDAAGQNGAGEKDDETSWIEIELLGEDDEPIPGESYELTLADGTVAAGALDADGWARIEGISPGSCRISFPKLDEDAWELVKTAGPRPTKK